jgi:drug/metabolite transporter (DMT)-like permease
MTALLPTIAPFVFVFLWSTGFISAKYGLRDAEPLTFLAIRMLVASAVLAMVAAAMRSAWPRDRRAYRDTAVAGLLLHAGYLGGVFVAIDHGMPAGLSSIIIGLQPILTAVLAQSMLGEGVTRRQWLGLTLGFAGVGLVVVERMRANGGSTSDIEAVAFVAIAVGLVSTTLGTIFQKRTGQRTPLMTGTAIQYGAAAAVLSLGAISTEDLAVDWSVSLLAVFAWSIVVMSFGAITLLMLMIRRSSVSRVSGYLYLVPPLTALEAYLLFDERLTGLAVVGMVAVVVGVALVVVTCGQTRR